MMISNRLLSYVSLSTFMCVGGVAGGGAITHKLAGYNAALSFAKFGACMVLALLLVQLILSLKGQKRAIYLILFNMAFTFGIVVFMSCLILPLFWVPAIESNVKLSLLLVSASLWIVNIKRGIDIFNLRWTDAGGKLLLRYYRKQEREIDWNGILGSLKMSIAIYMPGVPEVLNPLVSILIVISMLAGLSLRSIFPEASLFAWGVPIIIVISLIMQMVGFGIAQFLTLNSLEREAGAQIRPI
ncbi:hypothetical protein [Telluria aromaticivorans]|uniref:Uncharacterized protein n=1 Tax=Telluria aromaticivorans TaxID=2725995 RepID=A0A7Y2P1K4_9BURK|nr:hypothetical protein [Telluria aromaticivorans]NNG25329.1 hypothetical protein [Telluria aromaticivorans]